MTTHYEQKLEEQNEQLRGQLARLESILDNNYIFDVKYIGYDIRDQSIPLRELENRKLFHIGFKCYTNFDIKSQVLQYIENTPCYLTLEEKRDPFITLFNRYEMEVSKSTLEHPFRNWSDEIRIGNTFFAFSIHECYVRGGGEHE